MCKLHLKMARETVKAWVFLKSIPKIPSRAASRQGARGGPGAASSSEEGRGPRVPATPSPAATSPGKSKTWRKKEGKKNQTRERNQPRTLRETPAALRGSPPSAYLPLAHQAAAVARRWRHQRRGGKRDWLAGGRKARGKWRLPVGGKRVGSAPALTSGLARAQREPPVRECGECGDAGPGLGPGSCSARLGSRRGFPGGCGSAPPFPQPYPPGFTSAPTLGTAPLTAARGRAPPFLPPTPPPSRVRFYGDSARPDRGGGRGEGSVTPHPHPGAPWPRSGPRGVVEGGGGGARGGAKVSGVKGSGVGGLGEGRKKPCCC